MTASALEAVAGLPASRAGSSLRRQGRAADALALDAFDRFPNGIMVCDRHGRVVAANGRLWELVSGGSEPQRFARSCCRLLGCRRAGGPLEGACLTTRALESGERLPEIRIKPSDPRTATLWVTAAPLYEDGSHVVLELRPERDTPPAGPRIRIFALGPMRIETPERRLGGSWLEQRPGQLLRFLVCRRHEVVPTDVIAEAIWADPGAAAPATIRYLVYALRERLEPERGKNAESASIVSRRGGYALHPEQVWLDADEFEREVSAGLAALEAGDRSRASGCLERAMSLYEGDFLADEPYAEWALVERERLRALACNALRALSEIRGDQPGATAGYLERLAALEPLDDDVQRELISTWLRLGRKSRAARHYHSFRLRLLREFGEPPDFELAQLVSAADERGR
jgi:DNA-binding SARP family transcriptional activator